MKQLFFSLFLFFSVCHQIECKTIYVRYSEKNPIFKESADKLYAQLKLLSSKKPNKIKKLTLVNQSQKIITNKSDLVINVGSGNIENGLKNNAKNILSFTNKKYLEALSLEDKSKVLHSIVIEQPIKKSINLAEKLIKSHYKNKIIICLSENNKLTSKSFNEFLKKSEAQIKVVTIKKNQVPGKVIQKHLDNAVALIAVRDEHIWSKKNARLVFVVDNYIEVRDIKSEKIICPEQEVGINRNIAKALGFNIDALLIFREES